MQIEIYSKSNCAFCVKAKNLLNLKEIPFKEFIIQDPTNKHMDLKDNQKWITKEDLFNEFPNARTVPQIKIDNESIGGYNELVSYLDNAN